MKFKGVSATSLQDKTQMLPCQMGTGWLEASMAALLEWAKQVLFTYKANEIVGCMQGQGPEVARQLFPALVWPQLWLLCVSPLRRMWGTGRTPERSKNVIKD